MTPIILRDEQVPPDAAVVVRGGEMNGESVRRTAIGSHAEYGIFAVSVFVAFDVSVEQLCQERPELQRYRKVRLSTVDRLRSLGFALIPTLDRPHYDVVLPDVDDITLDRLELGFDLPIVNPGRPH